MKFLSLLGKPLKDDDVIDLLECNDMEVIYAFDRSHENQDDNYWSAAKDQGFQFRFNASQILDVIFLYVVPNEGFTPIQQKNCDVPFFSSLADVQNFGAQNKIRVVTGKAEFLGIRSEWARLEYGTHVVNYQFRDRALAQVTIMTKESCPNLT